MTISLGLLLLIVLLLAWKMKGAQIPHTFLGLVIGEAATEGSIVDTLAGQGLRIVDSVVNAVASGLGQGNIV